MGAVDRRLPMWCDPRMRFVVFIVGAGAIAGCATPHPTLASPVTPRPARAAPASTLAVTRSAVPTDNAELRRLHDDDQAARHGGTSSEEIKRGDAARRARALELYRAGALRTAADFYHAAVLFQHDLTIESSLLAHELSVAAVILGEPRAKAWVAMTEDRLLKLLGRKQRFGTQFSSRSDRNEGRVELDELEEGVTDTLRAVYGVPSLDSARESLRKWNRVAEATDLIVAGRLTEATRMLQEGAEQAEFRSVSDEIYYAEALLAVGRTDDAERAFRRLVARPDAGPYEHISSYLGLVRVGRQSEADHTLREFAARSKRTAEWPWPVVALLVGEITEGALVADLQRLHSASDRCEAYYYLGMARLARRQVAEARRFFQRAVESNEAFPLEYHFARAQLALLGKR
jgi:tetratricopeptide (TPR) repeat protein